MKTKPPGIDFQNSGILFLLFFFMLFNNPVIIAGPPYDTDDPVPVDFRSWELYFSSHSNYNRTLVQGTLPHFEVNYGVIKNMQLHLVAPLAFNSYYGGKNNYGPGDIEVGIKYRFIKETKFCPQVGVFPLCEIPTGNSARGLGNGKAQFFLPVWIQKSFGDKWQSYGGYGYWINPGSGNRNWNFIGLQTQYQLTEKINIGFEIYHTTPDTKDSKGDTRFNIGSVLDINTQNHILISLGRSFSNTSLLQCYVGYLFTISGSASAGISQHLRLMNNFVAEN